MERPTIEPVDVKPAAAPEPAPVKQLAVRAYGLTDRGLKREINEDQFLIAEVAKAIRIVGTSVPQPATSYGRARAHLFAVADGMGGHNGGSQASALAVTTIERFLLDTLRFSDASEQSMLRDFQAALIEADTRMIATGRKRPDLSGMGTTLTAAWYQDSELCVLHVGDSRCYLSRGPKLRQITQDHTLVAELQRRGAISAEEASQHSMRHVLTNVVGGPHAGVRVDMYRAHIEPGDGLLLCSDGLNEMVSDEFIQGVMTSETDPKRASERLMHAALSAGGFDNVTVVVARFDKADATSALH